MKTIVGIDPGANGGIAWSTVGDSFSSGCQKLPDTEADIITLIRSIACTNVDKTCFIEDVGGFCGVGQPGSAMFKFGFSTGFLRGVIMSLGFRVELVKPQKWQKHFGLGTARACGSKTIWKNKLKSESQRRYPDFDITLNSADAVLIMDYGISIQNK
jgi:hypothetical protein